MNAKKIILVNLSFEKIYEKTSMTGAAPTTPPLSLACISAALIDEGHEVRIFDFNLHTYIEYKKILQNFVPDFIGITFVTPLVREADKIAKMSKEINNKVIVIGGGPHCSSFPKSPLNETSIDIVVVGEGDFTIRDIVNGKSLSKIKGIAYKQNKIIIITQPRELIKDLDILPFPAYHLYEIKKYRTPSAIAMKNPVAWVETSRGCVYGCIYCNKSCFGRTFRYKSPKRVVDEFKKVKQLGFNEIHLTDDGFTTNIERAKEICRGLIRNKIKISWSTITGIRVDRVDFELLSLMKRAGCYRVYFGIESGNQQIINNIKKGITLDQVRKSVKMAKKARLEVVGYFMIGLPGETEKTMQDTIDFAKSLNLDLAKISITIPLPATELFNRLSEKKLIKTYDWEMFKFYTAPSKIYNHENLSWKVIEKYYNKFYRTLYLNPFFILKRSWKSLKRGTLFDDIKTALSMKLV